MAIKNNFEALVLGLLSVDWWNLANKAGIFLHFESIFIAFDSQIDNFVVTLEF